MKVEIGYLADSSSLRGDTKYYVHVTEDNNPNRYRYIYPDGSKSLGCWNTVEDNGWYKTKDEAIKALLLYLKTVPISL